MKMKMLVFLLMVTVGGVVGFASNQVCLAQAEATYRKCEADATILAQDRFLACMKQLPKDYAVCKSQKDELLHVLDVACTAQRDLAILLCPKEP